MTRPRRSRVIVVLRAVAFVLTIVVVGLYASRGAEMQLRLNECQERKP